MIMDVNRLLSDELSYELSIRGCVQGKTVDEKRSLLRQALQQEKCGGEFDANISFDVVAELNICAAKLEEIGGYLEEFSNGNAENEYKKIKTRLTHLQNRLKRLTPVSNVDKLKKTNLTDFCEGLFEALEGAYAISKLVKPQERSILDDPVPLLPEVVNTQSSANAIPRHDSQSLISFGDELDNAKPAQVHPVNPTYQEARPSLVQFNLPSNTLPPQSASFMQSTGLAARQELPRDLSTVQLLPTLAESRPNSNSEYYYRTADSFRKWNIYFDGNSSVTLFLEDLEEKAEARKVSKSVLFLSVSEFLKGDALLWYRARRNLFRNWDDFKSNLREAFLPPDYEINLMDEIRRRTQGQEEKLVIFVSRMQAMFNKLSTKPSEMDQVNLIRRNLLPSLHTGLALQNIQTVDELLSYGRTVEESQWRARQFVPPPTNFRYLQEPELAYRRPTSTSLHQKTSSIQSAHVSAALLEPSGGQLNKNYICWKCKQPGHFRAHCPQSSKRTCFKCRTTGYTTETCPKCSGNATANHCPANQ